MHFNSVERFELIRQRASRLEEGESCVSVAALDSSKLIGCRVCFCTQDSPIPCSYRSLVLAERSKSLFCPIWRVLLKSAPAGYERELSSQCEWQILRGWRLRAIRYVSYLLASGIDRTIKTHFRFRHQPPTGYALAVISSLEAFSKSAVTLCIVCRAITFLAGFAECSFNYRPIPTWETASLTTLRSLCWKFPRRAECGHWIWLQMAEVGELEI